MKVLAIDPGYERLGVAVIERNKKDVLLHSECFQTSPKEKIEKRLRQIGGKIESLILEYSPDTLAIENLFIEKNQKTAMRVAEARGIIIYEAAKAGLVIREFTPLQVKSAILSYGRGDKKQMMQMIPKLIEIKKTIKHDDEYDAIGIGITSLAYRQ